VKPTLAALSERLAAFELRPPAMELYARVTSYAGDDPATVLLNLLEQRAADGPEMVRSQPLEVPSLADLRRYLRPLPAVALRDAVVRVLTESLAYSVKDDTRTAEADLLADDIASLLGVDAHWWTNNSLLDPRVPYDAWGPVTERTFDACLVGVGGGVAVMIVSTDED
jgi:hypothetical protein